MKTTTRLALASICLASPVGAFANCLGAYSSYSSGGIFAEQALSNHPECFGGGATTSQALVSATAARQSSAISDALARRWTAPGAPSLAATGGARGMAAGDGAQPFNLWGNSSDEDTEQRYGNLSGNTTKNDFDIQNHILGADYGLASPALVFGLSVAIDKGDISGINTAPGEEENELTSHGYMVAPYLGWQINDELSLDASLGIGQGELHASDSSNQDVDRWYTGVNLNYQRWLGSWQLAARAGYLHAEEDYDDLKLHGDTEEQLGLTELQDSDATNELDRLQVSGQVGYWWNGWMPYAGLKYRDDVHRSTTQNFAPSDPIGKEAWVWALGVDFYSLAYGITGGVAYEQEEGRSHQNLNSWVANLSLRF